MEKCIERQDRWSVYFAQQLNSRSAVLCRDARYCKLSVDALRCRDYRLQAGDIEVHGMEGFTVMNGRQLTLDFGATEILLFVDAPTDVGPIDDYREVNFELPGKGRHRAVFFLLPDKHSDDSSATMPKNEWDVPVRWDDPTMMYVPTLGDESILAAMSYILTNELEDKAFENGDDIRLGAQ